MLEYVTLGDYQTAVGFLLASTPERSSRFYRDALCTIAMAVRISPLQMAGLNLDFETAAGEAQLWLQACHSRCTHKSYAQSFHDRSISHETLNFHLDYFLRLCKCICFLMNSCMKPSHHKLVIFEKL